MMQLISFLFIFSFGHAEFISGVKPNQRPQFPKITKTTVIDVKTLHGIEGDAPPSLKKATASQGAWYTPLTQPGMTGPYDLRGYHASADVARAESYNAAAWNPLHFSPAIEKATDAQCLKCHQEILNRKIKDTSQAGAPANQVTAWYQTLDTYSGDQQDIHWRHLQSPYAKRVARFQCNTCHQGHDPREEALVPNLADGTTPFTLRKGVHPRTCLMCHGAFPDSKIMGLPGPWPLVRDGFQNNCLLCHQTFRTNRHNVNFLNAAEIEEEGKKSGDSCFGCHGGRAWYRISFPYPRHSWPNMAKDIPEWAKERPTESEARFLESKGK